MKTKPQGTRSVPACRSDRNSSKFSEFIDFFLPEECRVKNISDFYRVAGIAFLCATFMFPPFVIGALYCINKAKKGSAV